MNDAMSGESKCGLRTVDFMKAFDSITHNPIWDGLKTCGIEHEYINLLKTLYKTHPKNYWTHSQRERHVRDQKGDQAGRPAMELALQHCSAWR